MTKVEKNRVIWTDIIYLENKITKILFERKIELLLAQRAITSFFVTITFFILQANQGLHKWGLDQDTQKGL